MARWAREEVSALGPGQTVSIVGLKSNAQLNGLTGNILLWDNKQERWLVQMDDGSKKLFKGANLQAATRPNMAAMLAKAPAPKKSAEALSGLPQGMEYYEVIKNMVFVKQDPHKDSKTVGIVRQGHKLEVCPRKVFDAEGHWWAELTDSQIMTCKFADSDGRPASRGYLLIDATHLGLGRLLRGPLPKSEWPTLEEAEAVAAQTAAPEAAAPPRPPPRSSAADGGWRATAPAAAGRAAGPLAETTGRTAPPPEVPAGDFQWFKVVKKMVFVKHAADKDARTVGIAQEGDKLQILPRQVMDSQGHAWAQLTELQIRRMGCDFGEDEEDGTEAFSLIDGRHLGLGPLLSGPLPRSEWPAPEEGPATTLPERDVAPPRPAPEPDGWHGGRTSSGQAVQVLEVVQAEAPVLQEPLPVAEELGRLSRGEHIEVEEETFDGWARLVNDAGWVRRCMHSKAGLITFLEPVGERPWLATSEISEVPGPRRFEVTVQPRVRVLSAPSGSAQVRGSKPVRESVFAEAQTYNGWIRLVDGEGWILAYSPKDGQMLHAPLFDELMAWCEQCRAAGKQYTKGSSVTFGDEHREDALVQLRSALEAGEPEGLRSAIKRARALGGFGEEVTAAESRLEELRRARASGLDVRAVSAPKGRPGPGGEASVVRPNSMAGEMAGCADLEDTAALEDLMAAATSGDTAAIRAATKAAKAAGVSKKDIARVFALSCGGNGG